MAGTATAQRAQQTARAWRDVDLATVRLEESSSDGFKRSWIMLMPEGEFEHPQYGKLAFTHTKLEEFKSNFDSRVRKIDIALDRDHDGGQATGWLEELALRDGGLWGLVRWTKLGEQLLGDQIYRYFSPEFGKFTDAETGKQFNNVIIGGGLTNRPFLKTMPAVKLKDKQMADGQRFERPGRYTKSDRAKIPAEDFAGPNQTFPIVTQQDVHDAARLIGHAANPAAVKARVMAIAKRKGFSLPDAWAADNASASASASEGAGTVARKATGSRKLADEAAERDEKETQQASAEQDDAEELDEGANELDESEEDEDLDEDESEDADGEEGDGEEGDETDDESGEDEETQEFADKSASSKSSKRGKGKKPANDAEDAQDGGADEDEEMDDVDIEYDDGSSDDSGDDEEMPAPRGKQAKRGEKGKAMQGNKAGTSRKMTEPQMEAEITRLREENRSLREEQFKLNVSRKLSEFAKNIRADGDDEAFALPRSFKLAYRAYMMAHGIRLAEDAVTSLDELVQLALKVGTVPLTSWSNGQKPADVADMDERRPRVSGNDPDMTPEAERISLSEHKMPLDLLAKKDPEAVEAIYMRLEKARGRKGDPAA